jgi:hypothetical protein
MVRPFKGTKRERALDERVAKVQEAMAQMPGKIAEWKAEKRAWKEEKADSPIEKILKKYVIEKKGAKMKGKKKKQ